MNKICSEASVWDLHVHTPYKYNKTANSFGRDENGIYVDKILEIINKSDNKLKMISFTDHNYFNLDVYKNFAEKSADSDITIIPGVEVDLKVDKKSNTTKHILFYFEEKESLEKLQKIINDNVTTREEDLYIDDFINILFLNQMKFAISPHAFKQGSRGIDSDWNDDDDEKNCARVKIFSSSFFVFWEPDKSSIAKAKEYIEKYYDDGDQAIVNFSDSHDYEKFEKYLNSPTQFFRSLNNFKGIMMVGSEKTRIVESNDKKLENLCEEKIKTVIMDGTTIEFSDKLNVIIGGRGKGKSILIEKLGYYFSCSEQVASSPERKKFLNKKTIIVKNFSDTELSKDVKIKFLNQSYINTLFSDESSKKIGDYFLDEFKSIPIEKSEDKINEFVRKFSQLKDQSAISNNVINITNSLKKSIKSQISFVDNKQTTNILNIYYETPDEKYSNSYFDYFKMAIPNEIFDNEVEEKTNDFVIMVLQKTLEFNKKQYLDKQLNNISIDVIEKMNEELDKKVKLKNASITSLKERLISIYENEMICIRAVNALYEVKEESTKIVIEFKKYLGDSDNKFYFTKYRNIEHPVEFARRIIVSSINGNIISSKNNLKNEDVFKNFVFGNQDIFNSGFSKKNVLELIKSMSGVYKEDKNKIIHYVAKDDEYRDLATSSPGMQTASLMEYVFNQESKIPILIDQPEDNIDNEARYKFLTQWIKKMKFNRQIILVSHDANIVINGDAENVIIADYEDSKFVYNYGALEFEDNIDKAAEILDGGKEAIRKRVQKYGE